MITSKLYKIFLTMCLSAGLLLQTGSTFAQDMAVLQARIESMEKELAEMRVLLDQKTQEAATEVEEIRNEVQVVRTSQNEFKTYDSKVHLAGYGAVGYSDEMLDTDGFEHSFSEVLFNPIFHYTYKDLFMLETELEMELEDGEALIGIEYMTVDWFINDYVTLMAGKFQSPIGQFRQNLHPAWINKLPSAPVGFGHEGAAPISEVGLQLRGGFPLEMVNDTSLINYAVYVGNGPMLEVEEEDGEFEIHTVGSVGVTTDEDDDKIFGGRIGFLPFPNLELGFSGAFGDVAIDVEPTMSRDYEVLGTDLFYHWQNLDLRAEYVRQEVDELAGSIAEMGQAWEAWYAQASYKIFPTKIELVARYGELNSTHASQEQDQWSFGINYLLANHGMAKFAYEFNDGLTGSPKDDNRWLVQLAYGF